MSFSNKVVLVTGAASGIGAATAELFAEEGAKVAMVDKDGTRLKLMAERIARDEDTTLAIIANVANDDDAKRIIKETIDKFEKLDVLINCAGIARYGTILDGKLIQSYDDLISINLRAVMQMTCQAAPHLIKTKGNVVNIASVAGIQTTPSHLMAYSISKACVQHFTRGAALELAAHGVRVNTVSPGPVKTNIVINSGRETPWERFVETTSLNRICEPNEIADLIVYLASDKAKGTTGSNFINDNGALLK